MGGRFDAAANSRVQLESVPFCCKERCVPTLSKMSQGDPRNKNFAKHATMQLVAGGSAGKGYLWYFFITDWTKNSDVF